MKINFPFTQVRKNNFHENYKVFTVDERLRERNFGDFEAFWHFRFSSTSQTAFSSRAKFRAKFLNSTDDLKQTEFL